MELTRWVFTAGTFVTPLAIVTAMGAGAILAPITHYAEAQTQRAIPRLDAGRVFRDCANCPEMIVVPAGSFIMGSPTSESGRHENEGPQRVVVISQSFAVSKFEITKGQYAAFAKETARPALGNCWHWKTVQSKWVNDDPSINWKMPGFEQTDEHPAVCVSWEDSTAFAQWLSRKTGKHYRLLTEAEWEYAARATADTARPWGDDPDVACEHANVADQAFSRVVSFADPKQAVNSHRCDDGNPQTSRVGSYPPNRFGLHDMIGNALEWVDDCLNKSYVGAPRDGIAWTSGDCAQRMMRGGAWDNDARVARSAMRIWDSTTSRSSNVGFRIAQTL